MSENRQKRTGLILAGIAVGMFSFGFALVPLYKVFCNITGYNGGNSGGAERIELSELNLQPSDRVVTVQFDSTLNAGLNWDFAPRTRSMKVHPGKMYSMEYYAVNQTDKDIVAQAVPGITPWQATNYFNKAECFCFTQQTLAAGERKDMTLRFMIDPSLPEDIKILTLSYTFMNTDREALKNTVAQVED